jgi:hypothetical protein
VVQRADSGPRGAHAVLARRHAHRLAVLQPRAERLHAAIVEHVFG